MSADPGFDDLTPARRASLLALRQRVQARLYFAVELLEAVDKQFDPGHAVEVKKLAEARIKDYSTTEDVIMLQFPEIRADRRGSFDASSAADNKTIAECIKTVDVALANIVGVDWRELRAWFDTRRSTMPKPLPLMSAVGRRIEKNTKQRSGVAS